MARIKLFDLKIDAITHDQAVENVTSFLSKKSSSLICTVNTEFLIRSQDDSEFKNIINEKSSMNLVDGVGLIWSNGFLQVWQPNTPVVRDVYTIWFWLMSIILMPLSIKIFKKYIPERISGSDFIWDLANIAVKNDKQIFLLGNKLGLDQSIAEKVSLAMIAKVYKLKVGGVYDGTTSIDDETEIIDIIKRSNSDILILAFPSPAQEKWLAKNLAKTGCKIGIGLGGTFDFIAGVKKRAPKWIRKSGLEWLYRLIQQPRRIFRQMALPKLLWLSLKTKLKQS